MFVLACRPTRSHAGSRCGETICFWRWFLGFYCYWLCLQLHLHSLQPTLREFSDCICTSKARVSKQSFLPKIFNQRPKNEPVVASHQVLSNAYLLYGVQGRMQVPQNTNLHNWGSTHSHPAYLVGFFFLLLYGMADPRSNACPTHARHTALYDYKKAISQFIPRRTVTWDGIDSCGNPMWPETVNWMV